MLPNPLALFLPKLRIFSISEELVFKCSRSENHNRFKIVGFGFGDMFNLYFEPFKVSLSKTNSTAGFQQLLFGMVNPFSEQHMAVLILKNHRPTFSKKTYQAIFDKMGFVMFDQKVNSCLKGPQNSSSRSNNILENQCFYKPSNILNHRPIRLPNFDS